MSPVDSAVLGDIIAGLPVAVYRTTVDGRFVAGNDALVELLGAESFDSLAAVNVRDLYADPTRREFLLNRALAGESVPAERIELRRLDGTRVWVRVRSRAVAGEDGAVSFFEGVMEDVTDLTRADHELTRSNALLHAVTSMQTGFLAGDALAALLEDVLKALMDSLGAEHGIIADMRGDQEAPHLRSWATSRFHWDPRQGRQVLPDGRSMCEIPIVGNPLGLVVSTRAPLLSNDPQAAASGVPETVQELRNIVAVPIVRGGSVFGVIALANAPDGFDDWAIDYLTPLAAAAGSLIAATDAEHDRRVAEQRERDVTELARAIFAQAADAMLTFGDDGVIQGANAAAARMFATSREDLIGSPLRRLLPAGTGREYRERTMAALTSGEAIDLSVQTVDGADVQVEVTVVRSTISGSPVTALIGRDIAARKEIEAELRRAKDTAERTARAKDDLLAGMGHELRTPLNSVIGLASILGRGIYGDLDERQRDAVVRIERSGRHLLGVINDILDAAKSDAEGLTLDVAEVDLVEAVHEAASVVRELADQRDLSLVVRTPPVLPRITADRRRVVQMVINLLGNAAKFTPVGGRIEVTAEHRGDALAIVVRDSGIGIAPDMSEAVFEPFVQIDSSLARQHTGTGLGLTLTRRIARAHGGDVTLRSALGEGAEFTVMLPLETAASSPRP
ncbi:ATP-binding protein [Microbacterium sp. SSW1-59]|uniref:ATP-binding protein n=1 Tax=Microbacterium xanthum TaxID=3079794 RepID=UPI002AD57D8A|nr:ATP-binding protein [Microbacterium sp. SSW1-59]MDZ8201415.1 ATP-binding protein [Microbacterium sp. SSW1-59]